MYEIKRYLEYQHNLDTQCKSCMSNLASVFVYLQIHQNEVQGCLVIFLLLQHDSNTTCFRGERVQLGLVYNHMSHHHMPLLWIIPIEGWAHKWRKITSHWSTSSVRIGLYLFPCACFALIGWLFCYNCFQQYTLSKHLGFRATIYITIKPIPLSNRVACEADEK